LEGGLVCLGVLAPDLDHLGIEGAQFGDLRRGGVGGHEDARRHTELTRRISRCQAGVAAGRRDDALAGEFPTFLRGEQPVERAARLERAGVLQQLQLEDQPG